LVTINGIHLVACLIRIWN